MARSRARASRPGVLLECPDLDEVLEEKAEKAAKMAAKKAAKKAAKMAAYRP
ncbi:MAG: hypothetical protein IPK80_35100 [Nannocystis sp.]|nr:hypothetical protein [Nannocystis sp.]